MWEQGCSFKQDSGYEHYLRSKSLASLGYVMSCVAPASCPEGGPKRSQCRRYAPGSHQIPVETALWQPRQTRGHKHVQTALAGTSAYRGAEDGALSSSAVDAKTVLMQGEASRGQCLRTIMENPNLVNNALPLSGFQPQIESFQPGGMPTRCNKLAYKANPSNAFVAPGPLPLPMTILTGPFLPAA